MLNLRDGTDAISGRRRAGAIALAGRMLGAGLLSLFLVMTIAILF